MSEGIKKFDTKKFLIDIIYDIIGSYCYGLAINMFTAANHIAPGGVAGFSTLVNYLSNGLLGIGFVSFLVNVPLVIMAFIFLGKGFTFNSLKTVIIFTTIIDYGFPGIQPYTKNPLLAAMFAGVLIGVGLGLILSRGSSTGGTDILGLLIKKKMPHMSIAKLILAVDATVVIMSVIVYKNIESAILAFVTMYIDSVVMDKVIYGGDRGIMMFIISEKAKEIGNEIYNMTHRGATLLQAKGAFHGDEREIVLCAMRTNEMPKVKKVVKEMDPKAFVMVNEANEIMGNGFKSIDIE